MTQADSVHSTPPRSRSNSTAPSSSAAFIIASSTYNPLAGLLRGSCDTFSFTTSMTLAYMMTQRFVAYHKIDYFERTGSSKVRLFRDSLKTLQYIVEAIVYYNPLKLFLLLSLICGIAAAIMMLISLYFSIVTGIMLAVGAAMVAILMFGIGLLAVLLKQIMDRR